MTELRMTLSTVAAEFNDRVSKEAQPETPIGEPSKAALVEHANLLLSDRRIRRQFLPADLFHEPAWDMLLVLFVARGEHLPMNVKTLVSFSDAPITTSQRWIEQLHKLNLINRVSDPVDRRRMEISLSHQGDQAMSAYLRALIRNATYNADAQ
ncbi:hypothetical protein [Sphingomonas faeni]|uniref:hypothetical protein n=1 Tax=Sphingomonas faeni TaxID=185950 RepID=UPI00277FCC38|nr:hypothetical protein [Sphingomonas faeni]MDQ0840156.1 DNA-binding MarR family transcriptional regulator [Sphingomonas faeni]